jgi:hypothetical protein
MHVVLLLGSSTAGKSALCKELVMTYKWHSNSFDEAGAKATFAHLDKVKPFILQELEQHQLTNKLQALMTDNDIQNLASMGRLTISKGNHKIAHRFSSPELEGLEEILKKAGFADNEIPEIAKNFRLTTKIGDVVYKKHPFPDPMEKLYDETFSKSNTGQSIVLDIIPNQNSTAQTCIEYFKNRAQQYQEKNPNEPLTLSIVFAYCPPQKLSERILERNRQAEINNPGDKRVGLFPFEQLATLVTADEKFDETSKNKLSRTDLFYLVNRHANTDRVGDAMFLENPVDPDIMNTPFISPQTITTEGNAIKLTLESDEHQQQISEHPRIGSKETINKYSDLAKRFGMFKNQEQSSLNIPAGLSFDAIIDTSKGTPDTLAKEFLEQLKNSLQTQQRSSKFP